MSNAEHLIENALICLEKDRDKEWFFDSEINKEMSELDNVSLDVVWDIAMYVKYVYIPNLNE